MRASVVAFLILIPDSPFAIKSQKPAVTFLCKVKDFQTLNFTNLDIWSRDPLSLDGGVEEGGLIDPSCPTRPPAQPQPLESNRNCEAARAGRLLLLLREISSSGLHFEKHVVRTKSQIQLDPLFSLKVVSEIPPGSYWFQQQQLQYPVKQLSTERTKSTSESILANSLFSLLSVSNWIPPT